MFTSAYKEISPTGEEPVCTTFKQRTSVVKACIDYIFYCLPWSAEEAGVEFGPIGVLTLPDITEKAPVPNQFYPSDHFHLVADIKYNR